MSQVGLSRILWLAATMAVVLSLAAPVVAGERHATLTVTARVVDRCTVGLRRGLDPALWRRHPGRLIRQVCRGIPPGHARAAPFIWRRWQHSREWPGRPLRVDHRRPRGHGPILITLTY